MPNFAFYGGREQATTKFYFSFCTLIWSQGIQLRVVTKISSFPLLVHITPWSERKVIWYKVDHFMERHVAQAFRDKTFTETGACELETNPVWFSRRNSYPEWYESRGYLRNFFSRAICR